MRWDEFAKAINGNYKETSVNFIGGDKITRQISLIKKDEKINLIKITTRSFSASSHYNLEKLFVEFCLKDKIEQAIHIKNRHLIDRILRPFKPPYCATGDRRILNDLYQNSDFKYLMKYPKSEIIISGTNVKFKTQCGGQMKEDLRLIFSSLKKIQNHLRKEH